MTSRPPPDPHDPVVPEWLEADLDLRGSDLADCIREALEQEPPAFDFYDYHQELP